jgi:hypothetical protein
MLPTHASGVNQDSRLNANSITTVVDMSPHRRGPAASMPENLILRANLFAD